jgi:hypothetical protein
MNGKDRHCEPGRSKDYLWPSNPASSWGTKLDCFALRAMKLELVIAQDFKPRIAVMRWRHPLRRSKFERGSSGLPGILL